MIEPTNRVATRVLVKLNFASPPNQLYPLDSIGSCGLFGWCREASHCVTRTAESLAKREHGKSWMRSKQRIKRRCRDDSYRDVGPMWDGPMFQRLLIFSLSSLRAFVVLVMMSCLPWILTVTGPLVRGKVLSWVSWLGM